MTWYNARKALTARDAKDAEENPPENLLKGFLWCARTVAKFTVMDCILENSLLLYLSRFSSASLASLAVTVLWGYSHDPDPISELAVTEHSTHGKVG